MGTLLDWGRGELGSNGILVQVWLGEVTESVDTPGNYFHSP